MNREEFLQDRNSALLSLDEKKIRAYMKKYEIDFPVDDLTFWASIHRARLHITSFSEEEKRKSRDWLMIRDMEAEI